MFGARRDRRDALSGAQRVADRPVAFFGARRSGARS